MELGILLIICFILGIFVGAFIPKKKHGTLMMDLTNPESPRWMMVFHNPLDEVADRKEYRFKVDPNAKLPDSQEKQSV